MKVLLLGAGGREHALAWRLSRDEEVGELVAAPGNPGITMICRCVPAELEDLDDLVALARRERPDLTVVGPEAPLGQGLADRFRDLGLAILGPSRRGADLECSKVFSKHFMARQNIPTAAFAVCDTLEAALAAVGGDTFGFPVVIKADGLAAGKGVVIADDRRAAEDAIRAAMVGRQFGASGDRLVIEECLTGPEASVFVLCDGERGVLLSSAEDHKRIWDDDKGPNTGGMGAFAPSPRVTPEIEDFVMRQVVTPVLNGMKADGERYVGFLYVSLMFTPAGPKVIEFNVRFGDPEAQVVLPLLEGPFARVLLAAATGQLADAPTLVPGSDRLVGVVLASGGYPASSPTGHVIRGMDEAARVPNALVFHAGTKLADGQVVTAGGRVLTVVGRGPTYERAMATAYEAASRIQFDGVQFRRDIGRKALSAFPQVSR